MREVVSLRGSLRVSVGADDGESTARDVPLLRGSLDRRGSRTGATGGTGAADTLEGDCRPSGVLQLQ